MKHHSQRRKFFLCLIFGAPLWQNSAYYFIQGDHVKKILLSLTVGACALFSISTQAAIQRCDKPTDGDWTGYCSCFIEQAVSACNSCPSVHGTCTAAWITTGMHHSTTSLIHTQCKNNINEDSGNNCVAPGTTQESCEASVADYKAHCF